MDRLNGRRVDELSTMLGAINVRSAVYCLSDFAAPWGFEVERSPVAKFHVVLRGAAVLTCGDEPVTLAGGDLVLLPLGDGHIVQDRPGSAVQFLDRILLDHPVADDGRLAYGGDGARTRLLCGGFELRRSLPDELADLLPRTLVLNAAGAGLTRWLEPLFAMLQEEAGTSAPGASAIFAKLADVLLSQALRSYLAAADGPATARLAASLDPGIARVVKMLRGQPELHWTVNELARLAGMSRTSFTARFRAVMGEPPIGYLTRLRLSRAAGYLSTTTKNVRHVARLAGYENEASFSKAFSRAYGRPPGAYRRDRFTAPTLGAPIAPGLVADAARPPAPGS